MGINFWKIAEIPNKVISEVILTRKHVERGENLKIDGRISIHGYGKIIIGDNVVIHCNPHINPIGGLTTTFLQTIGNGMIIIGNNCGISHCAITAASQVIIEDEVLLGSGCKIYDTDFHELSYEDRKKENISKISVKPVRICEGAFIGANTIILKGVTIGRHCVVGAGSVVTHNIPENEIWAGNPARFIKKIK